jgi:hypothetical protein
MIMPYTIVFSANDAEDVSGVDAKTAQTPLTAFLLFGRRGLVDKLREQLGSHFFCPFCARGGGLLRSCLYGQPDLDQPADRLGAREIRFFLLRDPGIQSGERIIQHPYTNGRAGARRDRPTPSFRASVN